MAQSTLRINVIQGECKVSSDPQAVISTLLGSCVATCMFDPVARVGGMNHFLLPGNSTDVRMAHADRYGVHLMELLINELLKMGAKRDRLETKLFGGANTVKGLKDIGGGNAAFAQSFLKKEGILCVGGSIGGTRGRRINYWPTTGRANQMLIEDVYIKPSTTPSVLDSAGELELF